MTKPKIRLSLYLSEVKMRSIFRNETSSLFTRAEKVEDFLNVLFVINIFFMIIINIFNSDIINIALIVINILYVSISVIIDVLLKNIAEDEQRKSMISDAFNINITSYDSEDYYTNNAKPSIKRMGVNTFESTLYTNMLLSKIMIEKIIKVVIEIILYVIIIVKENNIGLAVTLTSLLFSSEIAQDLLKTIYYKIKVKQIYDELYGIFVTHGYSKKFEPKIILYVINYECVKSYCHINLPNKLFLKNRDLIGDKWNEINSNIK